LLKLIPLLSGEHLLQTLIGLSANLIELRLRLFSQLAQLSASIVKYQMYLVSLVLRELQPIQHLLKAASWVITWPKPLLVHTKGQRSPRKAQEKYHCRCTSDLPLTSG
jgi:hypothetical protein